MSRVIKKHLSLQDDTGAALTGGTRTVMCLRQGATVTVGAALASGGGTGTIRVKHPGSIQNTDKLDVILAANQAAGTTEANVDLLVTSGPTWNTNGWDYGITNNGSASITPAGGDRLVMDGSEPASGTNQSVLLSIVSDSSTMATSAGLNPVNGHIEVWIEDEVGCDFRVSGTSLTTRYIIDENVESRMFVNPMDYGALFDGSTDDFAAWKAALQEAKALDADIWMPPGISVFKTTLELPDAVGIAGSGKGASILRFAPASSDIGLAKEPLLLASVQNSHFRDFTVEGNANTTIIWDATDMTRCRWDHVDFDGDDVANLVAIHLEDSTYTGTMNTFISCEFRNGTTATGVGIEVGAGANDTHFYACRVNYFKNSVTCIGTNLNQAKFTDCLFENWAAGTGDTDGCVMLGGTGGHSFKACRMETSGGNSNGYTIVDAIVTNRCVLDATWYTGTTITNQVKVVGTDEADGDYYRLADGGRTRSAYFEMVSDSPVSGGSKWTSNMAMGGNKIILGDEVETSNTDNEFIQKQAAFVEAAITADPGSLVMRSGNAAGNHWWQKHTGTSNTGWAPFLSFLAGEEVIASLNGSIVMTTQATILEITGTNSIQEIKLPSSPAEEDVAGRLLICRFASTAALEHEDNTALDGYIHLDDGADQTFALRDVIVFIGQIDEVNNSYFWKEVFRTNYF